jgi:hypothetical protein
MGINSSSGAEETVGTSTNEGISFEVEIFNMGAVATTHFRLSESHSTTGAAARSTNMNGVLIDNAARGVASDSVRFYWSSSADFDTIGKIYIYGVKNA